MFLSIKHTDPLSLFHTHALHPQRSFSTDLFCSTHITFVEGLIFVFLKFLSFCLISGNCDTSYQGIPLFFSYPWIFFFSLWDLKLSQSGTFLIENAILPLSLLSLLFLAMHHAVLPYSDTSALRTPCLPPDSFLLPQPSTGKHVPLSWF